MCARERRREARAKFCGVSFRRFLVNAGRHVVSGVFVENAGRCTPESAAFFVVSVQLYAGMQRQREGRLKLLGSSLK